MDEHGDVEDDQSGGREDFESWDEERKGEQKRTRVCEVPFSAKSHDSTLLATFFIVKESVEGSLTTQRARR